MSGGSTGNALYLGAARSAVSSKAPANKIGSLDPPVFDRPYDKSGILINDLAPINGPTETFMGSLDLAPSPDEQTYPNIARWVKGYGWIEIGSDGMRASWVRVLDEGGMIWEGGDPSQSLDATLRELDLALAEWFREQFRS